MSNKIVPQVYRNIIDEVVNALRGDFEEYGVGEEVLATLQQKWESKVMASRAADFENNAPNGAAPMSVSPVKQQQPPQVHNPPDMKLKQSNSPYIPSHPLPTQIKAEPTDGRFPPHYPPAYGRMPHGLQGLAPPNSNNLMLPRGAPPRFAPAMPQTDGPADGPETRRMLMERYAWMRPMLEEREQLEEELPQVDGPGDGPSIPPLSLGGPSVPPLSLNGAGGGGGVPGIPPLSLGTPPPLNLSALNSNASHPSLGMRTTSVVSTASSTANTSNSTSTAATTSFARNPNVAALPSEEITSDLDDSEEEDANVDKDGTPHDPKADVTFCTYDKVTRVKTKWKVVFRDGMVRANGRDYLFGRCNGEFDWI